MLSNLIQDGIPVSRTILADINQFVRGNPILSTAILGTTTAGITAGVVAIRKKRKGKKRVKRKKRTVKRRSRKKAKRTRRRTRKTRRKKGIIRGRGLGSREIRHSGRSTRGKMKVVSFVTKQGKRVKFKVRR